MKNPAREVSNSEFVLACVGFQQAKSNLMQFVGDVDLERLDRFSREVYDVANKALRRRIAEAPTRTLRAVKSGERMPLPVAIAQAMRGRRKFTSEDVEAGLKKAGNLPQSGNIRAYLTTTMAANPTTFRRLERGVYTLKKKRRSITLKKAPKELPATTS